MNLISQVLFGATLIVVMAGASRAAEEVKPTRQAFLGEVLDAQATPVTPKFADYTPGSYHVAKQDLVNGLTDEAKKRNITLRAVSIVGPAGADPLWTSYVIVFFQEAEKIRVNLLVMPHARITFKSTGLITGERYQKWREDVLGTGVLMSDAVHATTTGATPTKPARTARTPFDSEALLVMWNADGKPREVFHGMLDNEEKIRKLLEHYNGLLDGLTRTYPEKRE